MKLKFVVVLALSQTFVYIQRYETVEKGRKQSKRKNFLLRFITYEHFQTPFPCQGFPIKSVAALLVEYYHTVETRVRDCFDPPELLVKELDLRSDRH